MGQPKRSRRKFEKPKKPYDKTRIEEEKKIMKEFGLRRKKELWKMETLIRDFRRRARELQSEQNKEEEIELKKKLSKFGLLNQESNLEDILDLTSKDLLSRRMQTVLYKKGLANTLRQARQFIAHGHVFLDGRKIKWPSFLVSVEDEAKIHLNPKLESKLIEKENKEE